MEVEARRGRDIKTHTRTQNAKWFCVRADSRAKDVKGGRNLQQARLDQAHVCRKLTRQLRAFLLSSFLCLLSLDAICMYVWGSRSIPLLSSAASPRLVVVIDAGESFITFCWNGKQREKSPAARKMTQPLSQQTAVPNLPALFRRGRLLVKMNLSGCE
ncbi:hypothetical protein B0J15DRAFT_165081 [Fusarium solani]|uniref:Uncharacterized protein n=1 Tax=Fusarium solani TaxID=169388 RepID=A0A9P9L0Y3_FUSSL|nr:uncharacterized protein B0J15DRAFT_165081 [Fusarium solani]KAH7272021.1 hypothetical protein B0J15DRAFT_165081 [Fusarium solani]